MRSLQISQLMITVEQSQCQALLMEGLREQLPVLMWVACVTLAQSESPCAGAVVTAEEVFGTTCPRAAAKVFCFS